MSEAKDILVIANLNMDLILDADRICNVAPNGWLPPW